MSRVALVSQTLRAAHCRAFVEQEPDDWHVLTLNPRAFVELKSSIQAVVEVSPTRGLLSKSDLVRDRWLRPLARWARSGSNLGRWLDSLAQRLRPQTRSSTAAAAAPKEEISAEQLRDSSIYAYLRRLHRTDPVTEIVVFDVFDLPVGLTFAEDFGVPLSVR